MNTNNFPETPEAQKTERKVVMDVQDITRSLPLGHERIEILKGIRFQIMVESLSPSSDHPVQGKAPCLVLSPV